MRQLFLLSFVACASLVPVMNAQTMTVDEYEPRSTLVVPKHIVTRAKFPFIDVHAHQRSVSSARVDSLIVAMDEMNMGIMVNLSGGTGERLAQTVEAMKGRYPHRFAVFANLNYDGIDDPAWGERAAAQLEQDVRNGAQGLKIFKNLGMTLEDGNGDRIPTDDPRFDPVWQKCAELGIPVLIHTGDPAPFWDPQDRLNERWFELKERPRRIRPPDRFPPWEQIMGEQWNVFRKHPRTTFISAHMAWLGGDLGRLGSLFDELPNMHGNRGSPASGSPSTRTESSLARTRGSRRSTMSTFVPWKLPTNTSTTTANDMHSGSSTDSISRTTCYVSSTTRMRSESSPESTRPSLTGSQPQAQARGYWATDSRRSTQNGGFFAVGGRGPLTSPSYLSLFVDRSWQLAAGARWGGAERSWVRSTGVGEPRLHQRRRHASSWQEGR